ncbi:MAG TPA: hypothetical protein VNB24_04960 [Acidimicrobiales bacterium]|nr:hypothetical protein [Acidimicrobiales bacterium]
MTRARYMAIALAVAVVAVAPACGSRDGDKLMLKKIVNRSMHVSGTYTYTDDVPGSFGGGEGQQVVVQGLVEDDFRFKARLNLNGNIILEEVVNDDALAVRFVDPTLIPNFAAQGAIDPQSKQALESNYWVVDPAGAPSIGEAAVDDRVLGIDPVVDSLSVIDYTLNAIDQAELVERFNEESLEYRPAEDPFPRPPKGGEIERWDLKPPGLPRADVQDASGQGGNVKLAQTPVFRKMALYIKDGRLVQIREQIAAEFDLLDDFKTYLIRLSKEGGPEAEKNTRDTVEKITDERQLSQFMFFVLNFALKGSGEEEVRPRSMVYEFRNQGEKVKADLPVGEDVRKGNLQFFGVNSKKSSSGGAGAGGGDGPSEDGATTPDGATTSPDGATTSPDGATTTPAPDGGSTSGSGGATVTPSPSP